MEAAIEERDSHVEWAEAELRRAGLFDEDSDYGGMMGEEVLRLVKAFSEAGHSGFSAGMAAHIFGLLAAWKPLTPLTGDPSEWMHIEVDVAGNDITWQSRRNPACFSRDGGRTYYDVDAKKSWWRRRFRRPKMHRTEWGE